MLSLPIIVICVGLNLAILLTIFTVRIKSMWLIIKILIIPIIWIAFLLVSIFIGAGYVEPVQKTHIDILEKIADTFAAEIDEAYELMMDFVPASPTGVSLKAYEENRAAWDSRALDLVIGVQQGILDMLNMNRYSCSVYFCKSIDGAYIMFYPPIGSGRYFVLYYSPDNAYDTWIPLNERPGWYYYTAPLS